RVGGSKGIVKRSVERGSLRYNKLIVWKSFAYFQHYRQLFFYLLFAASRKKCNDGLLINFSLAVADNQVCACLLFFSNFFNKGMPHISYIPVPFMEIVLFFKRKDDKHFVDTLLHHLYAIFFPCPHLRRNVVNHL